MIYFTLFCSNYISCSFALFEIQCVFNMYSTYQFKVFTFHVASGQLPYWQDNTENDSSLCVYIYVNDTKEKKEYKFLSLLGSYNKMTQFGWLINKGSLFLTVREPGKSSMSFSD